MIEDRARQAYEAARQHDADWPAWDDADEETRERFRETTRFLTAYTHKENYDGPEVVLEPITARHVHAFWRARREEDGWRLSEVWDPAAKTHPLLIPFRNLPENARRKVEAIFTILKRE